MTDLTEVNESIVTCYCNHLTNFAILVVSILCVQKAMPVDCILRPGKILFLFLLLQVNDQATSVLLKNET